MKSAEAPFSISGIKVAAGETREIYLKVSESFLSGSVQIPITVIRGRQPGPVGFVTAAIHGDEINGTDIVRRIIFDLDHEKLSGTLIAIPVVNITGFLSQSRYLPYHRDLNRFFPGDRKGNNAERFAARLFREVIQKCDFGIDLHTASEGRLNLPHVRGDMTIPRVRDLARAFGATVLVDQKGVKGSLRRAATDAGVPTILFEAGETGKFSRQISNAGLRGVLNVLSEMGLWPTHEQTRPPFQVIVKSSDWLRAEKGGILDLACRPGDLIYQDDLIGSVLNPFGKTVTQIRSPVTGIVIGVTTQPLSIPGTGIVHVARLKKALALVERALKKKGRLKKRLKRIAKAVTVGALAIAFGSSGCGTLTTPALRHATGDALGQGRVRVYGKLEMARMSPVVPSTAMSNGQEQTSSLWQGSSFGAQGEAGISPAIDAQLGVNFSKSGGGWRLGSKMHLLNLGFLSVGAMVGYGAYAGSGDVTYLTAGQPETLFQALSGHVLDISFPVSAKVGPYGTVYSGLNFAHIGVQGSSGDTYVAESQNDTGVNLGLRLTFGRVEGDLEFAFWRVHDPFMDSTKMVPFFGVSCGVLF